MSQRFDRAPSAWRVLRYLRAQFGMNQAAGGGEQLIVDRTIQPAIDVGIPPYKPVGTTNETIDVDGTGKFVTTTVPDQEYWLVYVINASLSGGVWTMDRIYVSYDHDMVLSVQGAGVTDINYEAAVPLPCPPGTTIGVYVNAYTSHGDLRIKSLRTVLPVPN